MTRRVERVGCTFIWKIENFSYCLEEKKEGLESPVFLADILDNTQWVLQLYPRGLTKDTEISFYIKMTSNGSGTGDVAFDDELSFLDNQSLPLVKRKGKSTVYLPNVSLGYLDFVKRSEIFGSRYPEFLPRDTLTVRCRIWKTDSELLKPRLYFAHTRIGVERTYCTWTVKEFSSFKPPQKCTLEVEPSLILHLSLACDDIVHIEVSGIRATQKYLLSCRISALDAIGRMIDCTEIEHLSKPDAADQICQFPQFITKSKLMSNQILYLPDDTLTLSVECAISVGVVYNQVQDCGSVSVQNTNTLVCSMGELHCLATEEKAVGSTSKMKEDLQNFYEESKFCDLTLRNGDKFFPVHKAVLCSRSPVFSAMLENEMKEKASDEIEIPDVDAPTIRRMLHFVYYDSVGDLDWESASQLYYVADKYGLLSLKEMCSSFFKANLCSGNVCSVLILADMHQDSNLKANAQEYILKHGDEVIDSEEWKCFITDNHQLAVETLSRVLLKKSRNLTLI